MEAGQWAVWELTERGSRDGFEETGWGERGEAAAGAAVSCWCAAIAIAAYQNGSSLGLWTVSFPTSLKCDIAWTETLSC